jgi:hypothetical protein
MFRIIACVIAALVFSSPCYSDEVVPQAIRPALWIVYAVILAVFVLAIIAISYIRQAIAASTFSLGDALSEESQITPYAKGC